MAKATGLASKLYVAGFDLSGDTAAIKQARGGPKALDFTGIDKSAYERLGGGRDGALDVTTFFNPTGGGAHPVWAALPTTDIIETFFVGQALGNPAANLNAKQVNYDWSRPADGSLVADVNGLSNSFGLEWGVQLTAGSRTDTTATSPASGVDLTTVSTAFGWQAYLHVVTFAGTSVTVTLQDSADNASFANFAGGGGAFTAVTGSGASQRLTSPGATDTVRRYVRAITTGTFTNAVFAVSFVRNPVAVVF